LLGISGEWGCRLIAERDEAREEQEKYKAWAEDSKRNAAYSVELYYQEAKKARAERDEAREQVKELIYIGERAIELADLDFENDKFGVVSELRNDLEKIKKSK
jgi:outer membrane protein TolC